MGNWTSIGREKYALGRQEGKEEIIALLINQRFGSVPSQVTERLDKLSSEQLNAFSVALLNFASITDVENWLKEKVRQ